MSLRTYTDWDGQTVAAPEIHPLNVATWATYYHLVGHAHQDTRVQGMLGLGGFDWPSVAARLSVHGLWKPGIEERLRLCERILLGVEHDLRQKDSTKE